MQSIITSYLLQTGQCSLLHIGTISITSKPAELDVVNQQLLAPSGKINFVEEATQTSPGLVKFLADANNISTDDAEARLNNFCKEWNERLHSGEALQFDTLGSLKKNTEGNLFFEEENQFEYLKPVAAERVLHKDAGHTILIGDNEVSSLSVNDYVTEEPVSKRPFWWIWATALAVIGLAAVIYHFSNIPFSSSATGNQTSLDVDSAVVNHYDPSVINIK